MRNASRSQDVEAIVWLILAANLLDDDTALQAGVGHQLAQRFVERAPEYLSADLLVTFKVHVLPARWRYAAARYRRQAARPLRPQLRSRAGHPPCAPSAH